MAEHESVGAAPAQIPMDGPLILAGPSRTLQNLQPMRSLSLWSIRLNLVATKGIAINVRENGGTLGEAGAARRRGSRSLMRS